MLGFDDAGWRSHPQCQPAASHDLASGFTRIAVLLSRGKYTLRAVGFVPVASVQLLISTPAVLSSWFMTSSVAVHLAQAEYAMAASSSRYLRIRR
jgi:hypothetical protein